MLKKVMIICLALSFVFIGGIAFAGQGYGPAPGSGDGIPEGPEWPEWDFISHDSSIIIAGYDDDKGKGDQDKSRDSSCQEYIDGTALLLTSNQTQDPNTTEGAAEGANMTQEQSQKEEGIVPIQETVPEENQDKVQKENEPVQS